MLSWKLDDIRYNIKKNRVWKYCAWKYVEMNVVNIVDYCILALYVSVECIEQAHREPNYEKVKS